MKIFIREKRLGLARTSFQYHLPKMAALPNSANTDLSQGFTVSQVEQKYGWTESMVWSLALEGKDDCKRFKELGWGLRTWDQWEFNACDNRFGDDWPGRMNVLKSKPTGLFHLKGYPGPHVFPAL
jgi:hypothetical protein